MAEVGKPISEEERRQRPFRHLILYGVKMMVRRDIGGSEDIDKLGDVIAKGLVGKSAREAGTMVAKLLTKQKDGIKERQKRSIEEIERRVDLVETAQAQAALISSKDNKAAYELLRSAVAILIGGENPMATVDPLDHVLRD